MLSGFTLVACASLAAVAVVAEGSFAPTGIQGHFVEQFTPDWSERWSASKATKDEILGEVFSYVGEWAVEAPSVFPGIPGDDGLVIKTKAAHHAISVPFATPLVNDGKTLVVQYEVKLQNGLDCGGAYIKLLTDSDVGIQAEEFSDKTPYTIMFGPDRCGSTQKVHFIFRHKNPITGEVEEKHLVAPPPPKITKTTALYTLIVRPDQTFEIKINNLSVKTGSLLTDFSPAVNPPKMIDDVTDIKPENWVESPKIADPNEVKPADWDETAPQMIEDEDAVMPVDWYEDEEATIVDPSAVKPEEWSDEDDGDWIAPSIANPKCEEAAGCGPWKRPQIANPKFKGTWFADLIDNPDYIGVWAPKQLPNPDYFEDLTPSNFSPVGGIGIELWTMNEDILFDNIYVGHSEEDAAALAAETFEVKRQIEEALETAAIPEAPVVSTGEEPDYAANPLAWAQYKVQEFINIAVVDPVGAFKALPYTGAASGAVFATLIGMIGVFFSFLLPGPKPKVVKKSTAVAPAPIKPATAVAPVAEIPVVEKKEEPKGVTTRAGKGKAVQVE